MSDDNTRKMRNLLEHTVKCKHKECPVENCDKMILLLNHLLLKCKIPIINNCRDCKIMCEILYEHSKICKDSEICDVPKCQNIKDRAAAEILSGIKDEVLKIAEIAEIAEKVEKYHSVLDGYSSKRKSKKSSKRKSKRSSKRSSKRRLLKNIL